ncbi:MAG: bifunctional folylpolyglutamate synthase/dihydrofolate synthase [Chloroflexota bacterium]
MTDESYADTIRRLDDLYHQPLTPYGQIGLRRINYLLGQLDNPQRSFRAVHVAGSSGKGSTTTMIASVLQQAGFRTGCFRSPHLETYNERIAVNDAPISYDKWVTTFEQVWPVVERMVGDNCDGYAGGRPSWFEVMFALACIHFRAAGVEWASLETGMGGRLDATNTVQPEVAVVTTVSLEHTQILGKTIREIAGEKAAIIKSGAEAVTSVEEAEALSVIRQRARDVGAHLWEIPRDVRPCALERSLSGTFIDFHAGDARLRARLSLPGQYQWNNAAAAVAGVLALRRRGVDISDGAIVDGLETARFPGRMEVVSRNPLIVLDGAHHPAAMSALVASLDDLLPGRSLTVLFASLSDKDRSAMTVPLAGRVQRAIITRAPGTERAADPAKVARAFDGVAPEVTIIDDPAEALDEAQRLMSPGGALIVCGSLYLVGFARTRLATEEVRG